MSSESDELDLLESDLLAQTAQIVVQVRERLADITRREQALHAQAAMLEVDRRNLRTERAQFEAVSSETVGRQKQQQEDLARAQSDLQQAQHELTVRLVALDERDARFEEEKDLLLTRLRAEAQVAQASLDDDRLETQKERAKLESDRAQLERQRIAFVAELHRQRQAFEFALAVERQRIAEQLDDRVLSEEIKADKERLDHERDRFRQTVDEWYAQQAVSKSEISRERDELVAIRQRIDDEIRTLREAAVTEVELDRSRLQLEFDSRRKMLNQQMQQSEQELKRAHALNESRARFHQDRLERSKAELEQAHDALRLEYQRLRQGIETKAAQQRQCDSQLRRHRTMLNLFSESLDRHQATLFRLHASLQAEAVRRDELHNAQMMEWNRHRERVDAEQQRQSDLMGKHAKNLEGRRERLDDLRKELESRHEELLANRLAVDEAWAQICQTIGDESAQKRVDESRSRISNFHREIRESLAREKDQLAVQRQTLAQEKEELFEAQQQLLNLQAAQDDARKRVESELASTAIAQSEIKNLWTKEREAWIKERLSAEKVIRQLLGELSLSLAVSGHSPRSEMHIPGMPECEGLAA